MTCGNVDLSVETLDARTICERSTVVGCQQEPPRRREPSGGVAHWLGVDVDKARPLPAWVTSKKSRAELEAEARAKAAPTREEIVARQRAKWNARDRARARLTYKVRMALITEADHRCTYCGAEGDRGKWIGPDGKSWHLDHWTPLSRGGSLDLSNVVIACTACNGTKGTLCGSELVEWLLRSEGTPAWTEHRARMLAHLLDG